MQKPDISLPFQGRAAMIRPCLGALGLCAGVVLLLNCDRDQVSRSTTTSQAPAPQGAAPMGNMPMGNMPGGELPPPPRPTGAGALKWTLPKGWTETQGSGMRFATLTPPGGGKAELSVVVLPAPAGGELANVNRWRGQIGLPPLDEKALGSARQSVKSKAGVVSLYDFTSEGKEASRMITGLLTTSDNNIWFLKLVGDAAPVGKAKPDFIKYLETLHLD
jgi:hypothetical protein